MDVITDFCENEGGNKAWLEEVQQETGKKDTREWV